MRSLPATAAFSCLLLAASFTSALAADKLKVTITDIKNNGPIPERFAYCAPSPTQHTVPGRNISPAIRWSGAPMKTKSFAIVMVDPDVPTVFDDANKEGKTVPADMKRREFYHWVVVDVPLSVSGLEEGRDSHGISGTGGKMTGKTAYGITGANSYAEISKGTFGGYDGPCPPWNDELMHHYHFRVYALDKDTLGLSGNFTGAQAIRAITPHIVAQGEVVGTYTQNPQVKNH